MRASLRLDRTLAGYPYAGVLKALAIGEQSSIPAAQWQVFVRTGVNHLMSISGLHVTMVSSLAFFIAYWLWRRSRRLTLWLPARKAAAVAGVIAALAYALLSGFGVPAQRTLYMLVAMAVALWLGRGGNAFSVLALALFAVLMLDPWAVMSPGFWLSFGAVAVILYVSAGRVGRRPHWLAEWGRVQWAVTVGLVPALLAMFQQVSLISPLANAIAIPVISLVVTPITLLGTVLPFDFPLLAAHQSAFWCMAFLEWLSAVPGAVWQQHGPPFWTILAGTFGVGWLLLPRGFPARWLGLLWLAPMFLVLPERPGKSELWVTVLDVGQGLATVVRTSHHALLFDAGPSYGGEADAGSRIVVPFLRGSGVAVLDALVVSHGDMDHSGGAVSVLQGVPVTWTVSSLEKGNPMLAGAGAVVPCHVGQAWAWDGVGFEMLHPGRESYADRDIKSNNRSCVLKVSSAFGSVLLPADAERASERLMMQNSALSLAADVLVVPHHGSRNASSPEFVRAVYPGIAAFSVGYRNRFGHPAEEVIDRFRAERAEIWRTDRDGALEIRFAGGRVDVHGWRLQNRRYWQAR